MPNVFQITISAVDRATAVAKGVNASIGKITKPISDVKASVQAFSKETGLDKLGDRLVKVGGVASDAARRIGSIAPPLAAISAAGSIAGLAAMAHGWGRTATEISNTASVIDVTTDQLQKYRGAARLAGLSDTEMTSGLKSVGSAFEDAAAGRDTFIAGVLSSKRIGIHRMADGSVDTIRALHDVSNAAARITNAQARQKFLDIFGLGGLSPLLSKGGAAIDAYVAKYEKLDATMTPDQIARGERFNENMVALDASFGKLKYTIGEAVAPALVNIANALVPIANEYGPEFARWLDKIDWDKTIRKTAGFVDALGGVKTIAGGVALISFAGPIASTISLATQLVKVATVVVPTVIASLGTLGAAGIAAWGALKVAELAGLPDTDIKKGADAIRKGNWGAASAYLPAGDFIGALLSRASGGSNAWIADDIAKRHSARISSAADNSQTTSIVNRFEKMGWSPVQADGIAANLYRESSYDPAAVGDNGNAYGIAQWHQDRQEEFRKRFGKDIRQSTLDEQLQFVDYELRKGQRRNAGDALSRATTAAQAGETVSRLYESPAKADSEAAIRASDAAAIAGRVHVHIDMSNAPKGTKATVRSSGNATASANVGMPALMGPAI